MEKPWLTKIESADKDVLAKLDEEYLSSPLLEEIESDNFFNINSRDMSVMMKAKHQEAYEQERSDKVDEAYIGEIIGRIVNELLKSMGESEKLIDNAENLVTNEDLEKIPEHLRPQLTGTLAKGRYQQ